jgi:alpha-tubulin suppressor-like RCC1 family protein
VSIYGKLYVSGSCEHGKLGLGKSLRHGFVQLFTQVKDLPPMEFIACGPFHMLAISRYNSKKPTLQSGVTYSWGKNHKG